MSDIIDLAAHLDEFDGTLVRRGTPVEKHWITGTWETNFWTNLKLFRPKLSQNWTKNSQKTLMHLVLQFKVLKKIINYYQLQ